MIQEAGRAYQIEIQFWLLPSLAESWATARKCPMLFVNELLGQLLIIESKLHPAPRHISIMGSITAPGRLVSRTAPEIAALLRQDAVDAVLLVPV